MDTGLLATHEVQSPALCAFECVANDKCLSYNYEHESSSGLHSCELVDRTKNEALLTARVGYTHYETVQVRPVDSNIFTIEGCDVVSVFVCANVHGIKVTLANITCRRIEEGGGGSCYEVLKVVCLKNRLWSKLAFCDGID